MKGVVLTTAPVYTQVEAVIWDRIREFASLSGICSGKFGLNLPEPNLSDWRIAPGNYGKGMSTDKMERFQGWKGRILLIIDEAPGMRPDLFGTIKTFAGGDARILMMGNPSLAGGPFYEAFTSSLQDWHTMTIGAFDIPNLRPLVPDGIGNLSDETLTSMLMDLSEEELDYNPWPMLLTRRYAKRMIGDIDWDWRVMGRFPTKQADALIPLDWIERCAKLETIEVGDEEDLIAGVDVAAGGEAETVVAVRRGADLIHLEPIRSPDSRGPVVAALKPYKDRLKEVRVDADGPGEYFARHLVDLDFPVIRINNGGSPVGRTDADKAKAKEDFYNLKAQMWAQLREKFEQGRVRGLNDRATMSQLSVVRSVTTPAGQLAIERKEVLARRGVASPDRADAIVYTYFDFPPNAALRMWS